MVHGDNDSQQLRYPAHRVGARDGPGVVALHAHSFGLLLAVHQGPVQSAFAPVSWRHRPYSRTRC
eukprot:15441887-Alexandrium_andersonii.AAC.1